MRHFQFTIMGVFEADDEADARNIFDEILGGAQLDEPGMLDLKTDLVIMPRAYTESRGTDTEPEPTHDNAGYHGFEQGGPTHPWDQGAFFFPEDHPLGPLEREAYHLSRTAKSPEFGEGVKQGFATRARRQLTEGDPTAPEVTEGDDA